MTRDGARGVGRRTVLQTSGMALAASVGVVGTTRRASAQELCVILCGEDPEGGEYRIEVSDPNASGVSSTLESSDGVTNGSNASELEGYVAPGDRDEFKIEGGVTQAEFTGAVVCKIDGYNEPDVQTELDVFTADGQPEQAYTFGFTGSFAEPLSNTESDDYEGGGFVGNGDLEDTFAVDGVVDSFDTNPEEVDIEPPTTDDYVGCVPRR